MSRFQLYVNPRQKEWSDLCARPTKGLVKIGQNVKRITNMVKNQGDSALKFLAQDIDGILITNIAVSEAEFAEAEAQVDAATREAIEAAYANIEKFHKAQMPQTIEVETAPGVKCWQKPVPVEKVGLYIPGGTAPLFSTVLMLAIPAKVAGCSEIEICTPVSVVTGKVAPEVLYAAKRCGITKVYKAGGAQAIAAMAYGTETVGKVDKIFGPGNRFVTLAKQMLGGKVVAVDMPAGPSEVMVIADATADPAFVAADLLSQAEHGADSHVMLVADSRKVYTAVKAELATQIALLYRADFAAKSLRRSRCVVFDGRGSRQKMCDFANVYAPEHLIINTRNPWEMVERITAAGSVFVGPYTPESAGDYASGTNHTLPTGAWARSYSGVNVDAYMRKMTIQEISREGLSGLSRTITTLAEAEGLQAHANAVRLRLTEDE